MSNFFFFFPAVSHFARLLFPFCLRVLMPGGSTGAGGGALPSGPRVRGGSACPCPCAPLPVQWQPVHPCHRWAGPSTQTHSFTSMSNLAPRLQTHQGKLEEAEPLYRETLRDYRSAWLPVLSEKQSGRPRRSRPCWRTRTQSTILCAPRVAPGAASSRGGGAGRSERRSSPGVAPCAAFPTPTHSPVRIRAHLMRAWAAAWWAGWNGRAGARGKGPTAAPRAALIGGPESSARACP